MSKNVFKVGDVVYHAEWGKGTIRKTDRSSVPYWFDPEDDELVAFWGTDKLLSFSPWPAPDHKRSIQNGWWLVRYGVYPRLRRVSSGQIYDESGVKVGSDHTAYEFIRYLGKDWRTAE